MESWLIPAAPVTFSEEIKKSRFITLLAHTDGVEAAKAFVESVRAEHPDARHHCVAWVAGPPNDSQQLGFSDDGEPAGTAGKPILAQLMGSNIGEITAVVGGFYFTDNRRFSVKYPFRLVINPKYFYQQGVHRYRHVQH